MKYEDPMFEIAGSASDLIQAVGGISTDGGGHQLSLDSPLPLLEENE
jgi:hypothetical protein